jgi:hypothetical protein
MNNQKQGTEQGNTCKTSCICIFTFTLTVHKQTDINKVYLYGNQYSVNVINEGFI